MNQEIIYNGHSATPSDPQCPDGDLTLSINAIHENGSIHAVHKPTVLRTLPAGSTILFVHNTALFSHYIILNDRTLSWTDANMHDGPQTTLKILDPDIQLYEVNAIGNTLLVLTSSGMYYFLWKDEKYIALGNHFPELDIEFGLQATIEFSEQWQINFNELTYKIDGDYAIFADFSPENKSIISEQVMGKVNKFIAEKSTETNRFMFPFYVRYAYRLYDGSLTMHSAPVLMLCSGKFAPQVYTQELRGSHSDKANQADVFICAALHQLDFAASIQTQIEKLQHWSDIITSVDVFITPPIYTYDYNGQCQRLVFRKFEDDYSICKIAHQDPKFNAKFPNKRYQFIYLGAMYGLQTGSVDSKGDPMLPYNDNYRIELPAKPIDLLNEEFENSATFRFLHSIPLDKLDTKRTIIPIKTGFLNTLNTHELMSNDYRSHDVLIPRKSNVYNARLNLTGITSKLFKGFSNSQPYADGYICYNSKDALPEQFDYTMNTFTLYIYINESGKTEIVSTRLKLHYEIPFLFFFYPNPNAYKVIGIAGPNNTTAPSFEIRLKPHTLLNGAYYFAGFNNKSGRPEYTGKYPQSTEGIISYPNKIYTSEVNNPFKFSATGTNSIGTGTVLGICTAAKALSEGQFGQFPLYAFTDEGVWALEVSSTGSYSARQPITRDVCISPESITQIDNAVLFATQRGIMLLAGSTSTCISDAIDETQTFSLNEFPSGSALLKLALPHLKDVRLIPFREFLKTSRMLYDYFHQRIILYNPTQSYAYVFSLDSKRWGMIESNIASSVNSYPEALAMNHEGELINFSEEDSTQPVTSFLLTRPVKLDEPNVFKTIDTVIQRGIFNSTNVKQALFGSNDYRHWFAVKSSSSSYMRGFSGTPFKAFRIAVFTQLSEHESISGCSISFNPRMTGKLR